MEGIHPEILLAGAYALFLVLTATFLEWLARHTHRRAHHFRHSGFTFHEHLDAWQCPQGEYLRRADIDVDRKLVRYRARADGCNTCPMKIFCTDSDEGREIAHSTEDWLESEIGRFHRMFSLALLVLSTLVVTVAVVRHHNPVELALGVVALAGIITLGVRFARGLKPQEKPAPSIIPLSPWNSGETPDATRRPRHF